MANTGESMAPPPSPRAYSNGAQAGPTVHGDITVYARGSAAEELNELSALVR